MLEMDDRWDKQAAEKLPAYMKALFIFMLNTISDIVDELKLQKNKHAELAKELVRFASSKDHTMQKTTWFWFIMFNIVFMHLYV